MSKICWFQTKLKTIIYDKFKKEFNYADILHTSKISLLHQSINCSAMKKFNEEEMKNLQSVNNKIWSIFEELKNAHVSTEDYHILLFLLSLYKDGLLDERKFEETKDSIYKISNRLKPALDSQLIKYESIFPIFLPVVEFLSPEC